MSELERIIALENQMDIVSPGWRDPIIIDPSLTKPIYEGIVIQSLTQDYFVFNPAFLLNGKFTVYARKGNAVIMGTSNDGLSGWTWRDTNCAYGSIVYMPDLNTFRCSYHKWHFQIHGRCTSFYQGSTNGSAWSDMAYDFTQTSGEDRNLLYDNGLIRNYIRVNPTPRTIGYCESSNGYTWTPIVEILKPDSQDIPTLEFYEMSVIKTVRGYFGLLTTYDRATGIVNVQLAHSVNGKSDWRRLNNRQNFIDRKAGIKQLFGNWSVIGDTAYIYTIENVEDHEHGGNHFSCRYKISLTELYKYLD